MHVDMVCMLLDAALEQACRADADRTRLGRRDPARLQVAWSEAYG